ncbi:hypothetical protein RhiJN_26442 [Ceratobasidium sp. AG-Ba]|nr:hypothetical protein RhiJN_26442 [Ceratobasidium sp. AG-Ba]
MSALRLTEIIKGFRLNKTCWREFGYYIVTVTAGVIEGLMQAESLDDTIIAKLGRLKTVLEEAAIRVTQELTLPWYTRLNRALRDIDEIAQMRARVDEAIGLFQFSALLRIMAGTENSRQFVAQQASRNIIERLQRVQGASWDTYRLCLDGTRVEIMDKILAWAGDLNTPNRTEVGPGLNLMHGPTVLLLTAVAGAGKSTIAHTVAKRCAERRILASSFFFDRGTEGRNRPTWLMTTIAADISKLDRSIAKRVEAVLEDDPTLPSAPLSRQFENLVLKPCQDHSFERPAVIVIDALDEAWTDDLLVVLRDHAVRLPSAFRIFVTSRMRPELETLSRQPHVYRLDLDIGSRANLHDIRQFALDKLRELAVDRNLGANWPGEQLRDKFVEKAGGLFLWVATICDYLRHRDDPTLELNKFILENGSSASSAEVRMDKLYASILESCDWDDPSFLNSYDRVMTIVVALKTPLTISDMRTLHHNRMLSSDYTLQKLSPLLTGATGADHESRPLRMLHQSLRDFLVLRAGKTNFGITEQHGSQKLAILCLEIMNRQLVSKLPGTGYLMECKYKTPGIPTPESCEISKALLYACRFWPDHILDVEFHAEVEEELKIFLTQKLVLWIQLLAVHDRCRRLGDVRRWLQTKFNGFSGFITQEHGQVYADICMMLDTRLLYEDRKEEALEMLSEAVEIYRSLQKSDHVSYTPKLALSLNMVSHRLSELGHHEEGLQAIQESVRLWTELSEGQPDEFMPPLAKALNIFSLCLSNLGRHHEARWVTLRAVEKHRQLARDDPVVFTPGLAKSLNRMSNILSYLNEDTEALEIIEEVVELHRRLVAEQEGYEPLYNLATSLNNLSNRLSDLHRPEEALAAAEESVTLFRQLASQRSILYTPGLSMSLHTLSRRLDCLERTGDALLAIQEAVEIRRHLTQTRPAAFNAEFAKSLNLLSVYASTLGHHDEALAGAREAVKVLTQLASTRPMVFNILLKTSLNKLSQLLTAMGCYHEAADVDKQATAL